MGQSGDSVITRLAAPVLKCAFAASIMTLFTIAGAFSEESDAKLLPSAPLHESVLNLPGDPERPVMLQVTLFTPDGPGPFPLAVMNHGAASNNHPKTDPRYRTTFSAYYFLSRGYAVALPMMRGFAGSGGSITRRGCDVAASGISDARDIAAVIDDLAALPNIDASRIVIAGQSFGGWNTLALGVVGHAGIKGLVNFAGGVRDSDCAFQDASLIDAAAYFGAHTSLASIWFYGDNDSIFPPSTWRAMYDRYTHAGGQAELIAIGNFMDDAHQLLSHPESLAIWTPRVDDFLARIGLPSAPTHPEYLPTPFPPPTHYAALDDDAAVPYLPATARDGYRDFLRRPFARAFVIAPNGTFVATDGGFDPIARALGLCRQHATDCELYAVDNDVVWAKKNPAGTATAVNPFVSRQTVRAGAISRLDFSYSVNPDCSSRGLPKIWIVQPPTHGTVKIESTTGFPSFPPNHPYADCNKIKVPGIGVDYRPVDGFTGADFFTLEEINLDNRDISFQFAIAVK